MTENEAITHTKSESGKKLAILDHLTIEFRVEKFKPMMKSYVSGENLESKEVSSELAPRAVWKLELYPKGYLDHNTGNVSVVLCLSGPMASDWETLDAISYIYLIDASGNKIDVAGRETNKFGEDEYVRGEVGHERVKKALQSDGSLRVVAEVEFLLSSGDDKVTAAREGHLIGKWHDSIGKLLEKRTNSDCTLMVGGEQLKAHQSILAAISPTFAEMFGNEAYQEAKDGIVRIEDPLGMLKDSSAKPYRALLCYAYTGRVDWILFGDCKRDVLVLACKYLVDDLKHHLETLLIDEINPKSFAELAILADTYSCAELKKACVLYISSNVQAVVLAPSWEVLLETRVDLVKELLRLARESKAAAAQ